MVARCAGAPSHANNGVPGLPGSAGLAIDSYTLQLQEQYKEEYEAQLRFEQSRAAAAQAPQHVAVAPPAPQPPSYVAQPQYQAQPVQQHTPATPQYQYQPQAPMPPPQRAASGSGTPVHDPKAPEFATVTNHARLLSEDLAGLLSNPNLNIDDHEALFKVLQQNSQDCQESGKRLAAYVAQLGQEAEQARASGAAPATVKNLEDRYHVVMDLYQRLAKILRDVSCYTSMHLAVHYTCSPLGRTT